jgi:hypothetical protein
MPQSETEASTSWLSTYRYKLLGGVVLAGLIIAMTSLLNSANKEDALVGKKEAMPSIDFQSEAAPAPTPTPVAATTANDPAINPSDNPSSPSTEAPTTTTAIGDAQTSTSAPQETGIGVTASSQQPPQQTSAVAENITIGTPPQPEPAVAAASPDVSASSAPAEETPEAQKRRTWQQNELHAIKNSAQKTTAVAKPAAAPTSAPEAPPATSETAFASTASSSTEPSVPAKPSKKKSAPTASGASKTSSAEEAEMFPNKPAPATTVKNKSLSADEKQLLALPETSYTLQLIGLSSAQTAQKFITQHSLTNKVTYFRTALNGKPLFVLVYGNYASLQEANAALSTLPQVVQNLKPMPRSMRIIQGTIQQGNIKPAALEKPVSAPPVPAQSSASSAPSDRFTRLDRRQ